MNSNQYGWYYEKSNMPIWLLLAPGRWWAELEFHLAGNGRLFLTGRRRRSIVWHGLYSISFYALVIFLAVYFLGLPLRSATSGNAARPADMREQSNASAPARRPSQVVAAVAEEAPEGLAPMQAGHSAEEDSPYAPPADYEAAPSEPNVLADEVLPGIVETGENTGL